MKIVIVEKVGSEIFEVSFELSLSHLPQGATNLGISDLKIIEKSDDKHALIVFKNGVFAVLNLEVNKLNENLLGIRLKELIKEAYKCLFTILFCFTLNPLFQRNP